MAIAIVCSECDKTIKAPDELAGKKIRCPNCKNVVRVEAPEPDDDIVEAELDEEPKPVRTKPKPSRRANDLESELFPNRKKRKRPRKENNVNYLAWFLGGGTVLTFIVIGILVWTFKGSEADMNANRTPPQGANTNNTKGTFGDAEPELAPGERKQMTIWNTHLLSPNVPGANGQSMGYRLRFDYRRNDSRIHFSNLALVIVPAQGEKMIFDIQADQFGMGAPIGQIGMNDSRGRMEISLGFVQEKSTNGFPRTRIRPSPRVGLGTQEYVPPPNLKSMLGNQAKVYLATPGRSTGNGEITEGEIISNIMLLKII